MIIYEENVLKWSDMPIKKSVYTKEIINNQMETSTPYPIDTKLNKKIKLWKGPIWKLKVDAMVHPTNETLYNPNNELSKEIINAAGKEVLKDLKILECCRTGEAISSSAGNLPAKLLIHTVGPKYNPKYINAAENALYGCYRSCLQIARVQKVRKIAFPPIYSKQRGYPRYEATHIALRTIRCFLNCYSDDFDSIIFCVNDEDYINYMTLLPAYFPRNNIEQIEAVSKVPKEKDLGEPLIPERRIRISSTPLDNQIERILYTELESNEAYHNFLKMVPDTDMEKVERRKRYLKENGKKKKSTLDLNLTISSNIFRSY